MRICATASTVCLLILVGGQIWACPGYFIFFYPGSSRGWPDLAVVLGAWVVSATVVYPVRAHGSLMTYALDSGLPLSLCVCGGGEVSQL